MSDITIETAAGPRQFSGDGPIRIGRDPSCEVVLDNPNVSRNHAELRRAGDAWVIVDTNSTQGVFVDGKQVTERALEGRTTVTLGRTGGAAQLTIDVGAAPASDARTQLPPAGTVIVDESAPPEPAELQRPGGALREGDLAAGTVVTGQTLNVQCGGRTYSFEPGRTVAIGRDDTCDIVADNPTVSRRHALLRHEGGAWHLVDLDSSRGTFVDGERVKDLALSGSVAVWLGDEDAGERIVLVTSGEHTPSKRSRRALAARNGKILTAVAGVAVIGVIVAVVALVTRGGSGSGESGNNRLAKATVQIAAPDYTGSGVVIDAKKGLIITNAHVGDQKAPGLAVQYPDEFLDFGKSPAELTVLVSPGVDQAAEPKYRAKVVAIDGYLDVAVLKITKTAAGAFISKGDLKGLTDIPVGDSGKIQSGDHIRVVGYPGVSQSLDPTLTAGVVASSVQDDRLGTNRAWFNVTADASPGSSGGAVVDSHNRLVGVFAATVSTSSATAKRGRPVNLAKPIIDAAEHGRTYVSPYINPLPKKAAIVAAQVIAPDHNSAGYDDGCSGTTAAVAADSPGVGVQVQYKEFKDGVHQDMIILIEDATQSALVGRRDTNSQWPFKFRAAGCLTATVATPNGIDASHQYKALIFFGPSYDHVVSIDFTAGSNDNNNNNNNVNPPPSANG